MNILIESGATKSTCIGYNGSCTFFMYKTTGINATYATKEVIIAIFEDIIFKNNIVVDEIGNIRFYGAGCFNVNNADKIKEALTSLFPNANITVFSDLYAACHALCGNNKGFVGILGTGAASCFYDGERIIDQAPSLGWLLGDEGSGVYLGKQFVAAYFAETIELEIANDFEKTFSVSKSTVLEKI
jgi:N-acetylglucosamine kinase-like BadF-type ATPase